MAIIGKYLRYEVKKDPRKTVISINRLIDYFVNVRRFNELSLSRAWMLFIIQEFSIIMQFLNSRFKERIEIVRETMKGFSILINRFFINYPELM